MSAENSIPEAVVAQLGVETLESQVRTRSMSGMDYGEISICRIIKALSAEKTVGYLVRFTPLDDLFCLYWHFEKLSEAIAWASKRGFEIGEDD